MKQRTIFGAAMLAAIVTGPSHAELSAVPGYPFVYTRGSAEQEVAPNVGGITFSLWIHETKPEAALARLKQRSVEVLAGLAKVGVDSADIESHRVQQLFESAEPYRQQSGQPPKYIVTREFSVTVRKLESWNALLSLLIGKPDVNDLQVSFDRTDRATIEAEVELKAAEDARQQAVRMAKALGRRLGAAAAISPVEFDRIPHAFDITLGEDTTETRERMSMGSPSSGDFTVPATVTVQQQVNVLFELD